MTKKSRRLIDDCFLHDKDRLRHDAALDILKTRLSPLVGSSRLPLAAISGRILAEEIIAPRDVPLHDNAAVDGYAYNAAYYDRTGGRFPVLARIPAGALNPPVLAPDTAARIFTGAIMPDGADTVVMQEDCTIEEDGSKIFVTIPKGLKPGANRRRSGEDVAAGDTVLSPGHLLRPQDIAAIASTGKAEVEVFGQLRIGLISTGNEIRRPGEDIKPGEVYDSNHFLLNALLQAVGADITDCGIIEDEEDAVRDVMQKAAETHDVIITTGGASRGEEDHVITALDALGKRHMWQMAIKPGRPMTFGQISGESHDCLFFGLPGNPVAAMICFLLYVKPALGVCGGGNWREPTRYPLPAQFEIPSKKPDRREFLRGILVKDQDGNQGVQKFQRDGSGIITSLREADGLIEISETVTGIGFGEPVNFIPFSEFGIN